MVRCRDPTGIYPLESMKQHPYHTRNSCKERDVEATAVSDCTLRYDRRAVRDGQAGSQRETLLELHQASRDVVPAVFRTSDMICSSWKIVYCSAGRAGAHALSRLESTRSIARFVPHDLRARI